MLAAKYMRGCGDSALPQRASGTYYAHCFHVGQIFHVGIVGCALFKLHNKTQYCNGVRVTLVYIQFT